MYRRIILGCEVYILIAAPLMFPWFWSGKDIRQRRPHTFLAFAEDLLSGWSNIDKAPRLSISIDIWILSSDTETSAATPLGGGARKVLAK